MKVAAFQAPLARTSLPAAIDAIAAVVRWCEVLEVAILCCPEAFLGGLADDAPDPDAIAIGEPDLLRLVGGLASETVTSVFGFTERGGNGRLYNSAAVLSNGQIRGLYRKRYPARRASIYAVGSESPVFNAGGIRFGILICNDTNHPDLASRMVADGAQVLFVPSNNALPHARADVADVTRAADSHIATQNRVPVVRADVAGKDAKRTAFGTSAIIHADGTVLRTGTPLSEDLLIADIDLGL